MNEPHGGRPNSRSSRNAIPIEIKVAAISKIQSGRRPDTVSHEMEVPVGLINKWWLQREDIRTQFERYSKVQDYQERQFQKSLENGCDKDCDEKESKSDVGTKKDPSYEEKVSIVKGGSSRKGKMKKKGESPFKSRKRIELPTKSKSGNSEVSEKPPPIKSMPKAPQRRASNANESKTQAPARRKSSSTRELVANLFPSGLSPPKNKNKTRVSDEERPVKRVRVSSPGAIPRMTNSRRMSFASDRGVSPPISSVTSSLTPGDVTSELSRIKDEIASPSKDQSHSSLQKPMANNLSNPDNTQIPNNEHIVDSIQSMPGIEFTLNSPVTASFSTAPATISSLPNPDRRPSQESQSVASFQNDIMKELNISLDLSSNQSQTVANPSAQPPPAGVHSVPVPLTSHTISIKKEINAEAPVSQQQNLHSFPQNFPVIPSSGETQSYPLVPSETNSNQYYTPYLVPTSSSSLDDIAEPEPTVNHVNSSRINIKKEMNQEYIEDTPPVPLAIGQDTSIANKYYSSIGASAPSSYDPSPSVSHQTSSAVSVKRERASPEPDTSSAQDPSPYYKYGLTAGPSAPAQSAQTQPYPALPQPVVGQPPLPQARPVIRGRGQLRPMMRGRGGQPLIRGVRPPGARPASPMIRGASPNVRGQPNVRGVRPMLRGARPLARGQMRPGMRPQGGQPRLLRPPGARPGQPQPVRGMRGGPGVRPAAPRQAAPRPAAPAIPSSLQRIGGLSVTRQAPVELPTNLRLPSGISLSHPRGIQNQPPETRQPQHQAPVQRRTYEAPSQRQSNEAPKKKVTLELSQQQIDALKSLGML